MLPPLAIPADWSAVQHDGYVVMLAPSNDAELRVTKVNLEQPPLDAKLWLGGVVHVNRKLGRTIEPLQFGSFTGYGMEINALGNRIRAWFLHSGPVGVVITYRTTESVGTRDDAVVQAAVEALQE